ncbi:MAG: polysaccharide biosynthesis protein [Nitrospinota bacterium]|nr:polysaccharide biosynthesis protein [Nitrospinota bacterium]
MNFFLADNFKIYSNLILVFLADTAIFAFSYFFSFWLRFEDPGEFAYHLNTVFYPTVAWIICIKMVVFGYFDLRRGMWRYTSLVDLVNVLKASVFSLLLALIFMLMYSFPTMAFSRSVFFIDVMVSASLISLFRVGIRIYYGGRSGISSARFFLSPVSTNRQDGIPVAIYRADERGEMLLRSLMSNSAEHHYRVVGLIDDDPRLSGVMIHGLPVLGPSTNLQRISEQFGLKELLLASRVATPQFEELSGACRRLNIQMRIVPAFLDERKNRIDATSLRDARIEDLLSRDPVCIEHSTVEKTFKGRRILITGAGGSIGSQLARQIAEFSPGVLILVDKSENYLFQLEVDLAARFSGLDIVYKIMDITNYSRMEKLFETYRPEYVFHAAAHKHVPMMERDKEEVILNNIGGMRTVADLSCIHGAKKFILISTDKAVNPANAMGVTKRVCELYMYYKNKQRSTEFLAVRFGNVLGSNGSVAPLFMKQIENRGPVTVTHPDIERFFMTIPEAVLLILQAVSLGAGGELYILNMGSPVKISDLAEKMIRLAGFTPGKEIDIIYTGLRPGEKLTEELTNEIETIKDTSHPKIKKVAVNGAPWTGIEKEVDRWLKDCLKEPEKTYRLMAEWVNNLQPRPDKKIIRLPSSQAEG